MHGSKVVYNDAPEQFLILFKALNSECGRPLIDVTPVEITESFFTKMDMKKMIEQRKALYRLS